MKTDKINGNKRIKVVLIFAVMIFGVNTYAQRGWSSGNFYSERGNVWKEYSCDRMAYRTVVWHQEYHEGYVRTWRYNPYNGRYYWASEWRSGYFWNYSWSRWYPVRRCRW
ncbi:hypothetical protein [Labilibacter marinus]|uniref:hypothetical protein n=1 Tax=Labilibacter marinus TaxID=1477105 RepID=UPI00117B163C|nr:hypothetical protein [Labilibacter marinus]